MFKRFNINKIILKNKLIYFFQKKCYFFFFILKDRYHTGSFFIILLISFLFHYYNYLESVILLTKIFLFTLGYMIYVFIQLLLVPVYIMYLFKLYGIDIKNNKIKFIIIKIIVLVLIRLFLIYYLGLSYYINILFLDLDLLSLFDYKLLIFKVSNSYNPFIKYISNNIILSDKNIKSTSFKYIMSPIDEYESLKKYNSPRSSSPVNNNLYYNSPSPSSHLSVVNPRITSSPRYLSPIVSPTISPLFGSISLNGSFVGSPSPLLNLSSLPISYTPPLNVSPIAYLGSSMGSISPSFSDEYVTNESLRKGKFNPKYNTIYSNKIETNKSLLCSVLPNFKPVGLYYLDPSSSQSFTFFNFIIINHFEIKSMYIPEIHRYYDPINSI